MYGLRYFAEDGGSEQQERDWQEKPVVAADWYSWCMEDGQSSDTDYLDTMSIWSEWEKTYWKRSKTLVMFIRTYSICQEGLETL